MLGKLYIVLIMSCLAARAQSSGAPIAAAETVPAPAFEVATIKPIDPNGSGPMGFYSRPGGRVFLGYASVKMILYFAFDIQQFQISGGPGWVETQRYNVVALPPDSSPSRTAKQPSIAATPTAEQRKMLQSLLLSRFRLQYHWESKESSVYILSRGTKELLLTAPKHPDGDSRGTVVLKPGGIADGEAFGNNISMTLLASQLGGLLGVPVLDQTGLTGGYDFDLPPSDPDNHDISAAVFDAMDRLGLKLRRGRGPVDMLVIDHVEPPTEN
jgi:uncharacterized protein (TIGR03435 family)